MPNERQPIPLSELGANRSALENRVKKGTEWYAHVGTGKIKPTDIENIERLGTARDNIILYVNRAATQLEQVKSQIGTHPQLIENAQKYQDEVKLKTGKVKHIRSMFKRGHVAPGWMKIVEKEYEDLINKPRNDKILRIGLEKLKQQKEAEEQAKRALEERAAVEKAIEALGQQAAAEQAAKAEETTPLLPTLIIDPIIGVIEIVKGESRKTVKMMPRKNPLKILLTLSEDTSKEMAPKDLLAESQRNKVALAINQIRESLDDLHEKKILISTKKGRNVTYRLNANVEIVGEEKAERKTGRVILDKEKKQIIIDGKSETIKDVELPLISYLYDHYGEDVPTQTLAKILAEKKHKSKPSWVLGDLKKTILKGILTNSRGTNNAKWRLGEPKKIAKDTAKAATAASVKTPEAAKTPEDEGQPLSVVEAAILADEIQRRNGKKIKFNNYPETVLEVEEEIIADCKKLWEDFKKSGIKIPQQEFLQIRKTLPTKLRAIIKENGDIDEKALAKCENNDSLQRLLIWLFVANEGTMRGAIISLFQNEPVAEYTVDGFLNLTSYQATVSVGDAPKEDTAPSKPAISTDMTPASSDIKSAANEPHETTRVISVKEDPAQELPLSTLMRVRESIHSGQIRISQLFEIFPNLRKGFADNSKKLGIKFEEKKGHSYISAENIALLLYTKSHKELNPRQIREIRRMIVNAVTEIAKEKK